MSADIMLADIIPARSEYIMFWMQGGQSRMWRGRLSGRAGGAASYPAGEATFEDLFSKLCPGFEEMTSVFLVENSSDPLLAKISDRKG